MKTLLKTAIITLGIASSSAFATTFTFTPNPSDLGDLDHHTATTWGIVWNAIPAGHSITSATLKINNLWDWQVEQDFLYIHLLDDPIMGVNSWTDNNNDTLNGDYFNNQGVHLTTWTDPNGGNNGANSVNYVYNFTPSQLQTLASYITDSNAWYDGDFGFGIDADCHYYNTGVTFEITTGPATVADGGSTFALLGFAVAGVLGLRRRLAA